MTSLNSMHDRRRVKPELPDQVIVLRVRTNPEPHDRLAKVNAERTIVETDSD